MRRLILLLTLLPTLSVAQELSCNVSVNVGPKVQTTDRAIFDDMKSAIQQFINARKWTNDTFQPHEKISCSILININDMPSIGIFSASVQVQSARPVYNTNYTSLILNFADRDWEFDYLESQPLQYNDNTYTSNLTSMLAFYAYLVIGYDFDTFSELGGTPYFQKAMTVVNNAQSANRPGWDALGSNRNRYWIVENLLNSQFTDVRKAVYRYHRLGLDTFADQPDKSREIIVGGLKDILKAREINPGAVVLVSFLDAKSNELINVFSQGNIQVRREAYDVVTNLDPSNRSSYEGIIRN